MSMVLKKELNNNEPIEVKPLTPAEKSIQEQLAEQRLKMDLDSVKLNYANFAEREKTINDRDAELIKATNQLTTDRLSFTQEREKLLENYGKHKQEYDDLMASIRTREDEAKKLMDEAISTKSKADGIIKSQTEAEKINQTKQVAYADNMNDAVKLCIDINRILKRQDDSKALDMAVLLGKDLVLISRLQDKNVNLQTVADIISVDCDRLTELCEHLQDSKRDYSVVVKYLLDSVEWLQSALKIEWTPVATETPLT